MDGKSIVMKCAHHIKWKENLNMKSVKVLMNF